MDEERGPRGGRGDDGETAVPDHERWVGMMVELLTADGPLRGRVQVYAGPMRLADLVSSAQELTDVVAARSAARIQREGGHVSCRAGCGACCRQMVPISPPEAFYIADLIHALPADRRGTVMRRFEDVRQRLEREGMLEAVFDIEKLQRASFETPVPEEASPDGASPGRAYPERTLPDGMPSGGTPPRGTIRERLRAVNQRYFHLRIACPFLEEESCGIHPLRPVACREYSVTTPAAWCSDPFTHPLELVSMPLPLSVALSRLTAELIGEAPVLIPLSLAPFWAEEHASLRDLTWPGLDLFRGFLRHAGPPDAGEAGETSPAPGRMIP